MHLDASCCVVAPLAAIMKRMLRTPHQNGLESCVSSESWNCTMDRSGCETDLGQNVVLRLHLNK